MRSFCPVCVPGGIFNCDCPTCVPTPSMVGTSIFAPSAASTIVTGTLMWMSSPTRWNSLCPLTLMIRYRSPAGAPSVPALPLPASRIRCPSRVPALMRNSSGSRFVSTPAPSHVLHSFCTLPLPPQRGHWMLNFIRPPICVTWPDPWHSGHSIAPPTTARPLHVGHCSWRWISSRVTPPRIAVQKSISTWYSRSVPGCGPRACRGPPCPPLNMPVNTS